MHYTSEHQFKQPEMTEALAEKNDNSIHDSTYFAFVGTGYKLRETRETAYGLPRESVLLVVLTTELRPTATRHQEEPDGNHMEELCGKECNAE